jgi:hypothetical protein
MEGVGNRTARVYPEDPPALARAKVAFALGKKGAKSPDGKRKWDRQPLPAVAEELLWAGEVQSRGQPGNAGQFGPGGGGGKKDPKKGKAKKEKEEKPTVAAMLEHIAGLRAGKPTAAHLSDLAEKLGTMTVKDLHTLKTQLGGKGGKTKPEVVARIQAAVTGTPAAKPPAAKKAPAGKAPPAAEPPAAPPPGHLTAVMSMFRDMGGDRGSDDAKDVGRLREGAQMLAPGMTDADFAAAAEHLRSRGVDLPPVAPAAAAKKPPAARPPAAGKPTVEGMARHIEGLRAAGPPTAAHLDDLSQKLGAMTVKDLHTLKTQLGGKGGKVKAEVVAKIREAVAGAPAAKPPAAAPRPPTPGVFKHPEGYKPPSPMAAPNEALPDDARPPLSLAEAKAVEWYTSGAHRALNKSLRAGQEPAGPAAAQHAALQAAFAKARPFAEPVPVRRALQFGSAAGREAYVKQFTAAGVGGTVRLPGYQSADVGPSNFQGDVTLHIAARKGLDAKPYSRRAGSEDEMLLPANDHYVVRGVEKTADGWQVRLEQVVGGAA